VFALCTGITIATYSVIDGLGARTTNDLISYIIYLMVLDGLPFGLVVMFLRRHVFMDSLRTN